MHLDPAGDSWAVFVEWSGRSSLAPLSASRMRERREVYLKRDNSMSDWIDLGTDLSPISILASIVLGLIMFAVFPLVAPLFAAIGVAIVAIAEVAILLGIAAFTIAARTLFGRPWRVLAVNDRGETWAWSQTGWRDARKLADRIRDELAAGSAPDVIPPGSSTPQGQGRRYDPNDSDLARKFWVRLASKMLAIVGGVWLLFVIAAAIWG